METTTKEYQKQYREKNKERLSAQNKAKYQANKDKILKKRKEDYESNGEHIRKLRRESTARNKEKIAEKSKIYRDKNKEWIKEKKAKFQKDNKERLNKISKEYYEANKDELIKKNKIYREENKEQVDKYTEIYRNKNRISINEKCRGYAKTEKGKEVHRLSNYKRRALKKSTEDGTISKESLEELRIKQKDKCFYCSCELDFVSSRAVHLDHYIPLSSGGTHSINNVVWSCDTCNLKKGVSIPTKPLVFMLP